MTLLSKLWNFKSVPYSCRDYTHPWTHSCTDAAAGVFVDAVQDSFRIYATVYTLALVMRGKIPSKQHLKKTMYGILQSTAFLTTNAYSFMLAMCAVRRVLGSFNFLTVSFIPAFIASYLAILIERPSRRGLLALYVTNVASETLFRMAAKRGLVTPIPHGEVYIFMASVASLLYFFKAQRQSSKDSVISLLRFVVGPYEEKDYAENIEDLPSPSASRRSVAATLPSPPNSRHDMSATHPSPPTKRHNMSAARPWVLLALKHMLAQTCQPVVELMKRQSRHSSCPHPFSCVYYTLQGASKMFSIGYGLQACMTLLLRMKKIVRQPSILPTLLFSKEAFELGAFLGGFSGIFRLISCLLRHMFNKDSKYHAIIAGLFAGTTFYMYPSTTVALYMMWKTLQVIYNAGTVEGYVPELPWATILLYCFSTAVLFHAGVLEPSSLRPSYWKFLIGISGGRFRDINRECLQAYGTSNYDLLSVK